MWRMDNASRAEPGVQPQENRKYVDERLETVKFLEKPFISS